MNQANRYYMAYIESHEGRKLKVYLDSKKNKTIGVGHLVTEEDERWNYGLKFCEAITDKECEELFIKDIEIHIKRAMIAIPSFGLYPYYVRAAIIDGFFRGDLSGSPKTLALINEGKWKEASIEYLNNKEYKLAKQNKSGVWKRMLENSYHFANYAEEITEEK